MVAAMDTVGVDGEIFISAFSMYRYDASYAVDVQRAHSGRFALVKPVDPHNPAVADVCEWGKFEQQQPRPKLKASAIPSTRENAGNRQLSPPPSSGQGCKAQQLRYRRIEKPQSGPTTECPTRTRHRPTSPTPGWSPRGRHCPGPPRARPCARGASGGPLLRPQSGRPNAFRVGP
jgi:hypothetical protein